MAEYMVKKGYRVTVIAGFPYYPQWIINDEYKERKAYQKEEINGVTVFRYKQYVPENPTFLKRIVHLLSFTMGSFFNIFKPPNPDVVIAIVPFTSGILLGWILKLRYKAKLWVHIQDFEFDAAIDSGLLNNNKSIFISLLLWIEKKLLKKADIVSTISNGMLDKLNKKTGQDGYYLTNWLDISGLDVNYADSHKYLKATEFKILYSGNIGAKQDWDFFFKFMDELEKMEGIKVVVVGEGAEQNNVKKRLENYNFAEHYNLVPFNELSQLLSSTDLHVLFQKDDVIDTVMPSKILGMMGSSKPSLITGNVKSEVRKIIRVSEGGFYFENHQMKEIIGTVKLLQKDAGLSKNIGLKAKNYVAEKYSKVEVLNNFLEKLNTL